MPKLHVHPPMGQPVQPEQPAPEPEIREVKVNRRLGGLAEVAEQLGISKQAANKRHSAGHLPEPLAKLAMGPVWDLDAVAQHTADRAAEQDDDTDE